MEIVEILFALAVWLLVSYLGWRKKSAKRLPAPPVAEPPATMGGEPGLPPTGERGVAEELRDIMRHLRGELLDEPAELEPPPPEPVVPVPPMFEEAPPPEPQQPELPRLRSRRRRRSRLAADLMRDLTSGSRPLARAVLLREVLGPPVALREPESDLPGGR